MGRADAAEELSLDQAVDAAMDGVAILSDEGTYEYVNESHAQLYGYEDPSALVGRSWTELYGDSERERLEAEALSALRDRGEWRGEAVGRRRDGSTFHQELSLTTTGEGRIVCIVRDVSERREREEALERYESILTNIHDAVYTLDPEGHITWVNEVAVREFDIGYGREDLIGAHVSLLLDDADIEQSLALIGDLVENDPEGSRRCEIEIRTAYGDAVPCDLHLALLTDEDGEFAGTLGVLREITDRKRREQRLSVLNRVLRHNLRNDINVVLMRLQELAEGDEPGDGRIETARRKAEKIADLGEKARAVGNRLDRLDGRTRTVDAADLVREQCAALREQYPAATVTVEAPDSCPARADETLGLALENLLENAVKHGSTSGRPGAEGTVGGGPTVEVTVERIDREVAVRIADDGPGIPDAEVEALSGEETALEHGSGLGLWVAKWCVENNHGRVTIDRPADGGTVVTVRLRAAQTRM